MNNTDETESYFVCRACSSGITTSVDDDGTRHWSCDCGRTSGMMLAAGALDLGITDAPNSAVFTEEEWSNEQH